MPSRRSPRDTCRPSGSLAGGIHESARQGEHPVGGRPARRLLSYEAILRNLGENLIKASSSREALEQLLKNDIAVVLIDVSLPELDGFELSQIIRAHPRYHQTAVIFVSAANLSVTDRLMGYARGAVDYVGTDYS